MGAPYRTRARKGKLVRRPTLKGALMSPKPTFAAFSRVLATLGAVGAVACGGAAPAAESPVKAEEVPAAAEATPAAEAPATPASSDAAETTPAAADAAPAAS